MISKPCPSAGRWGLAMTGLAITGLACAALSITSLEPASAAPAASVARAEGPPPATNTGSQRSVGVATMPDRPPRAPEPADTSSGLLYRTTAGGELTAPTIGALGQSRALTGIVCASSRPADDS
jgi:hypothetical protein